MVNLDLIETLGSEALLHTDMDGMTFVARVETLGDVSHLAGVETLHVRPRTSEAVRCRNRTVSVTSAGGMR